MSRPTWEQRIARASDLSARLHAASELLHCYASLLRLQRDLYEAFRQGAVKEERFPAFVQAAAGIGTEEMARRAASVQSLDETAEDLFTRAFLQPWAEATFPKPRPGDWEITALCPCCGRKPQAAVLREEANGARRNLVCSLCQYEWEFRRLLCPSCAEDRFERLPVFRAEEFPALRVEACDTCRLYLLAIDMTVDGRAVPLVDEVAALSLHLWAREQGYRHLQPNLFGI